MSSALINFAVVTIFARESLEGGIIIIEYRTVIQRSASSTSSFSKEKALRAVTISALLASLFALIVCVAVAVPLAVLSKDFDASTAKIIEGVSKIVAAICILQLSLKLPKFFGLYYSKSEVKRMKRMGSGKSCVEVGNDFSSPTIKSNDEDEAKEDQSNSEVEANEESAQGKDSCHPEVALSLKSIRFNVAWNIWREVAECGVFLIPFFLAGEQIKTIPLSSAIGITVGLALCFGIFIANKRLKNTTVLTTFSVSLLALLSTGLFCGGCHKFEQVYGYTPIVWKLEGKFWDVHRLPMTIFKPFGYSDERTVLQMVTFWSWFVFSLMLHYSKWKKCYKKTKDDQSTSSRISSKEGVIGTEDLIADIGNEEKEGEKV